MKVVFKITQAQELIALAIANASREPRENP